MSKMKNIKKAHETAEARMDIIAPLLAPGLDKNTVRKLRETMLDTGCGLLEVFTNGPGDHETGAIRHIAFEVEDATDCAETVRKAGYEVFVGPKEIVEPSHAVIAFCYGPLKEQVEFFQPF